MIDGKKGRLTFVVLALALGGSAATAQAARATSQPVAVSLTQDGPVESLKTRNCLPRLASSDIAADHAGCLELQVLEAGHDAYVVLPLPQSVLLDRRSKLTAYVRAAESNGPVLMRWIAMDEDNGLIFQRQFEIVGGAWQRMEWPLPMWRWGNEKMGAWSEVKSLVLRVESQASEILLDQLAVEADDSVEAAAEEGMIKLAYANRPASMVRIDEFLVSTDALEEVPQEQLVAIVDHMKRIRGWIRRNFAGANKPVEDGGPVAMFVFRKREHYAEFFRNLGRQWSVDILPPACSGYTIQDICAATWEPPPDGKIRPVYLHEATHALVSRELRLLTGEPSQAWLQEGLANYLQLCLFPKSMRRDQYVKHFAQPIDKDSFFRPLSEILGKPVASARYAQLASLTAFLVQERPQWLQELAAGLAQKKDIKAILKEHDLTLDELQRQWMQWGQKEFAESTKDEIRPFPLPQEWTQALPPATDQMPRQQSQAPRQAIQPVLPR